MAKEAKIQESVAVTPAESVYSAEELAQNAQALFGVHIDIATAALRLKGVKEATVAEAKAIVKVFAERKVN